MHSVSFNRISTELDALSSVGHQKVARTKLCCGEYCWHMQGKNVNLNLQTTRSNYDLLYCRWNKDVGYCQGFNMLAAIILEVMDKSESDSLKVNKYNLPFGYKYV